MLRDPALERALSKRLAVKRIAAAADITSAAVSQWKRVPKRHVELVAKITGVSPDELRPDLFAADAIQTEAA